MDDLTSKFFQLLRFAIYEHEPIPLIESYEWDDIYKLAKKQTIAGVVFRAVQLMGTEATIPRELKMKWLYHVNNIKKRNKLLNQRSEQLAKMFKQDGFECCVLKGQGNAFMYPDPYVRTSGDIDLQVRGGRKEVLRYVKKRFPHVKTAYQHVDYPVFKDVIVEIHYLPIYMNNPLYNSRLTKWFNNQAHALYDHMVDVPDGTGSFPVPSLEFNIIFQLAHLMHHYLDEGIGLRHILDYYYLLRKVHEENICFDGISAKLKKFGLFHFAGAVMYIMHELLGLEKDFLVLPMDRNRGRRLLEVILQGGNFGKYSGLTNHSLLAKHFMKYWRILHFIGDYPGEAVCEPVFRTWHYFWRVKNS